MGWGNAHQVMSDDTSLEVLFGHDLHALNDSCGIDTSTYTA